ncbi:hypothetical protein [Curtobacterium sp. VKM Ac-1393]|uniref:hypothetical protein n=1 Tax=Curtobacterium sp. VKM Ac-1393 TaxID=2783814 RepID=UPI00188A75C6|nr:hypothetical protein [Curtobacterium sp. VKM Ac-1393]MBF4609457.1 hypothetical protein [Curtobacterium sp. VKM Ac-1393]
MPLDTERLLRVVATSPVLSRNIVQVARLEGTDVRYLDEHIGRNPFASTARPGDVRGAGRTAVGIAALAGLDPDAAAAVVAEMPEQEAVAARKAVPAARARGYAIDPGRVHPSVYGVAIPLDGYSGVSFGVPLIEVLPGVWQEHSRRYQEVVAALRAAAAVVMKTRT